jgi:hypothetical protein
MARLRRIALSLAVAALLLVATAPRPSLASPPPQPTEPAQPSKPARRRPPLGGALPPRPRPRPPRPVRTTNPGSGQGSWRCGRYARTPSAVTASMVLLDPPVRTPPPQTGHLRAQGPGKVAKCPNWSPGALVRRHARAACHLNRGQRGRWYEPDKSRLWQSPAGIPPHLLRIAGCSRLVASVSRTCSRPAFDSSRIWWDA